MLTIGYWIGNISLKSGGVSPYTWRLLETILEREKEHSIRLIIISSEENKEYCFDAIRKYNSMAKIKIIPRKNILLRISFLFRFIILSAQKKVPFFTLYNFWFQWTFFLNLDIVHIPYQTIPSCIKYHLACPIVITMHDVQEIHFPEFFTPQERAYRASRYLKSMILAESIVVSFDHIKKDLMKYFFIPENKIHVCPLPYQKIHIAIPNNTEVNTYKNKYLQWNNFLFYPAQSWRHKNHITLIKSVQLIKEKYGRIIHVVCTGKKNDFFTVLLKYIIENNLCSQIHFMDLVEDKELYWLYKNCYMVVIPSLYEAGSFPLLEAMSLGVPVICSSVTSLPETIGDMRFVFDPLNIEQLACLIIKMLDDHSMKLENIINGKKRISNLIKIDSFLYYINMWRELSAKI